METRVLLISGGGLLGSALGRDLPRLGVEVLPTSRRGETGTWPLDLERALAPQLEGIWASRPFTHAILCAAMADVDECFRQPELSRRVNVDAPRELFALCAERAVTPVFFSTDLVFDCAADWRKETDPLSPRTLYARQKAVAETLLPASALLFRTSKLMAMDPHPRSILTPIVKAGRGQGAYRAFRDQFITPVFVEDVARAVAVLLRARGAGTYHLAGEERFSRLELARLVCRELGLHSANIEEAEMASVRFSEPRGPCNTLSSEKIRREYGVRFTPLAEGLRALL